MRNGSLFVTAVGAAAVLALPGFAQEQETGFDVEEAQGAVDEMIGRVYVYGAVTPKSVEEIVAKLSDLGYTQIDEFDVEWDEYEVEAISPDGEEVEIHIDPITGRIIEIEENFL